MTARSLAPSLTLPAPAAAAVFFALPSTAGYARTTLAAAADVRYAAEGEAAPGRRTAHVDPTAIGYEAVKQEWTDQYVEVDPDRPELARFLGRVGRVVTVNWNYRALVEFATEAGKESEDGGWYDVALAHLRRLDPEVAKARYQPSANSAKAFPPKQG
jgi:hypothetical protein